MSHQPGDSWSPGDWITALRILAEGPLNVTPEGVPLVVHNIGAGAQEEDVFNWKVT